MKKINCEGEMFILRNNLGDFDDELGGWFAWFVYILFVVWYLFSLLYFPYGIFQRINKLVFRIYGRRVFFKFSVTMREVLHSFIVSVFVLCLVYKFLAERIMNPLYGDYFLNLCCKTKNFPPLFSYCLKLKDEQ